MAETSLADLDPYLASAYMEWVRKCTDVFAAQNLTGTVRIIQGWRDPAYQNELQSAGVSHLNGSESLHCCTVAGKPASKAFDFGVFDEDGGYVTNGDDPRYAAAGAVAKGMGLVWGGDFVHPGPDPDHIQLARIDSAPSCHMKSSGNFA